MAKKKKSQTKKKTSQTSLRSKKFGRRVLKASTRQTGKCYNSLENPIGIETERDETCRMLALAVTTH